MAIKTKTYDPSQVALTFMGINVRGFAKGSFIKASRNEDGFTTYVGSQGEVCRVRNLNRTGVVEVVLMATDPTNDLLDAIATVDEELGVGGIGPLMGKDGNSNTKIRSTEAWVQKKPDIDRADEAGTVTWVFSCAKLEMAPRGNVI